MAERRRSRRGKASRTKAVPQQELSVPERKDSDQQFKAPGETESAGDRALIQPSEGEAPALAGEEKTDRGPEPELSKEEVTQMSPTPEPRQYQGRDAGRGSSNLLAAAALIGIGALIEPELSLGMAIGGGL